MLTGIESKPMRSSLTVPAQWLKKGKKSTWLLVGLLHDATGKSETTKGVLSWLCTVLNTFFPYMSKYLCLFSVAAVFSCHIM